VSRYRALFIDLSGVLYNGPDVIAGAVDAIARAQASALELRFLTNTSRKTAAQVGDHLDKLGFKFSREQIITAPTAARDWLLQQGLRPWCLVHRDIHCEFATLDQAEPNAVLIADAAADFTYENLNRAFQLCLGGAALVGIGMNRYFKHNGELVLDAGPFIKAIEFAADTEATIVGKPAPAFFTQALANAGVCPEQVMMIGDDVHGDVEGAIAAGLDACLVRTGKYRAGDENRVSGKFSCVDSVVEAVELALNGAG
jgi:HAD superfamily hydrolase (TIGR01458 family)